MRGATVAVQRVAIIGAGMAGLTAARALVEAGRDVVVFDKSRGVGGRMATRRRFPDDFDHGAQYFTARSPAFRAQVDAWVAAGVVAPWTGTITSLGHPGASRGGSDRFVGTPRMTMPAKALAEGLTVELSFRATSLARGADGLWSVESEEGARHEGFGGVLVATPAPQAAPLLAAVPELQEAAASIPMLPCHAAMVRFEHPVATDFDGAFVADPRLAWAARNRSKPGRPDGETWVLHSTVEFSVEHLEHDPGELVPPLLEAFAAASGVRLPAVRSTDVHRWLLARAERPLGRSHLYDPERRIGVCGDWLLGDRVEQAFESGAALAAQVSES